MWTDATLPSRSSATIAVVVRTDTRSTQLPSAGHDRRTEDTPGRLVAPNSSGMLLRPPPTSPSAVPLMSDRPAVPSRSIVRTKNATPLLAGSIGFTGDSIEIQGGHLRTRGDGAVAPSERSAAAIPGTSARPSMGPPVGWGQTPSTDWMSRGRDLLTRLGGRRTRSRPRPRYSTGGSSPDVDSL